MLVAIIIIIATFSMSEKIGYPLKLTNLGQIINSFCMIVDRYQVCDYTRHFFVINSNCLKNSFKF